MPRSYHNMAHLIASERIVARLLFHRMIHAILTITLFWPSYIFLDDIPSFVPESKSYSWMAAVMSEAHWGYCCLAPALIGSVTLYARPWKLRTFGAGVLAAAHIALAFSFWLGKHDGVIVGFVGGYALCGIALAYDTASIGKRLARSVDSSRN